MKRLATAALCLIAVPAMAHPGHEAGLLAGLAHPFTGLDHLLAMLGIGLWSSRQAGGKGLLAAFVAMMAAGALAPFGVPLLEMGLSLSVLLTGLLLLASARLPMAAAFALVGAFAFLHGQAHGQELPQGVSAFGFLAASALLLMAGRLLGALRIERPAGAAIGVAGLCLLVGVA